jgi:hypothetical protein
MDEFRNREAAPPAEGRQGDAAQQGAVHILALVVLADAAHHSYLVIAEWGNFSRTGWTDVTERVSGFQFSVERLLAICRFEFAVERLAAVSISCLQKHVCVSQISPRFSSKP